MLALLSGCSKGGDDVDSVSRLRNGRRHLRWKPSRSFHSGRPGLAPGILRSSRRMAVRQPQGVAEVRAPRRQRRAAATAGGRTGGKPALRETGACAMFFFYLRHARAPEPALPSFFLSPAAALSAGRRDTCPSSQAIATSHARKSRAGGPPSAHCSVLDLAGLACQTPRQS